MAKQVNVAGLALIRLGVGVSALQDLGYTVNGATIVTEGHAVNIPGDENGGDDGPPIEIQMLGETARVRLELTKWDPAVQLVLETRLGGGTAGTPAAAGTLVFANSNFFRLVVNSPVTPRNFPCATLVRTPIEINKGTKYSRLVCEFECYKHPTSGVLWNATIS
jgi:hypothetical protein